MLNRHIESPVEGISILQDYIINNGVADLPEEVGSKLRELIKPGNSPVVAAVDAAEIIYARREELKGDLLEIGAQLASMCAQNNFHGMGNDNRGTQMAMTIRTMKEVASKAPPTKVEPPEPKPEYLPKPEATLNVAEAG